MGIAYKNHTIYPKHIYIREFKGRVDADESIRSLEFLVKNNLLNDDIKGIINDLTDCHLDMNMESFHKLMEFLKSHDQLRKIKLAVICTDPRMIVFPTLGEVQETSLKIKPFTSEKAAVEWIMST